MKEKIQGFIHERLGANEAPQDLATLLENYAKQLNFAENLDNPLPLAGAEILWTGKTYPLLDHDYLNDQDLADPDIMANVSAMRDTDKKLKFVLQMEDDSLLGYWQPDPGTPLKSCPLFWLDNEGQYRIAEGNSLASTLAYKLLVDGDIDTSQKVIKMFAALGVTITEISEDEIFAGMDKREAAVKETPQDYRHNRYLHYRR